jgi:nucleotide-binding universal stress UspA family protein
MSIVGAIVDYAEKEETDIIILGKSGSESTDFQRILLGSTAMGVVTYTHCNILVVK